MASPCSQLTTYTDILDLPRVLNIDNGDFLIVETPDGTSILDFEDFIIPIQNTTFGSTLSTLQTNIETLSTPPVFRASINSNTVLLSVTPPAVFPTPVKVAFGVRDFDTNNNYSTLSSRFTATIPGYYQFNAHVGSDVYASTNTAVNFKLNNTTDFGRSQSAGNFWSISDIYYLNAGDYVEVYARTTNSSNHTLSAGSFSGHFIRS